MGLHELKRYRVALAKQRSHRPCKQHNVIKRFCDDCERMYCPKCGDHQCVQMTKTMSIPKPETTHYKPPRIMIKMWQAVSCLGAIDIQVHQSANAWMVRFPPYAMNADSVANMTHRFWGVPTVRALAEPTSYQSGNDRKPFLHWWVSFRLKEEEDEH